MFGFTRIALLVFGIGMFLGGVMGFVKGHSVLSLASGVISLILLSVAFYLSNTKPKLSFGIGVGTAVCLSAVFIERVMKTGKMMPNAMLIGLCVIAAFLFGTALAQSKSTN